MPTRRSTAPQSATCSTCSRSTERTVDYSSDKKKGRHGAPPLQESTVATTTYECGKVSSKVRLAHIVERNLYQKSLVTATVDFPATSHSFPDFSAISGPATGCGSGAAPGHIRICVCPCDGCQTDV